MPGVPRLLPMVAVAVGGVLAVKVLMGIGALPDLMTGARAMAEGTARGGAETSKVSINPNAAATTPAGVTTIASRPAAVCAPTAAELARAAGLSPAELQVIQNLSARRGQLDQRETGLDTQMQLLAAAELRVNQRIAALTGLQGVVQGLLGQVDARREAELVRMVGVYETMRARDSAPRFMLLDDAVRLPIAERMNVRKLSAMLAAMPPAEAQRLTEALARRTSATAAAVASARAAAPAATTTAAAPAAASAPLASNGATPPAPAPTAASAAPGTPPAAAPAASARPAPRRRPAPAHAATPPAATSATPPAAPGAAVPPAAASAAPPRARPARSRPPRTTTPPASAPAAAPSPAAASPAPAVATAPPPPPAAISGG